MTTLDQDSLARELRTEEAVAAHIRAICFKTGPPALIGAELEWTVHHTAAPQAPLDADHLRHVLGRHAPAALRPGHTPDAPPPDPLPAGGTLTIEPGGQLEISSAPASSTAALHTAVTADLAHLTALLDDGGLRLGEHGIDPHRPPRRLLDTPRYRAMERAFDAHGPHGRVMMGSTAGLQVCLDVGTPAELPVRWGAAVALGPPLIALFANSARHAGRDTGLASARMAAWWGMDPRLTRPPLDPAATGPPTVGPPTMGPPTGGPPTMGPPTGGAGAGPSGDPAAAWVRYALDAPLVCLRRDNGSWDPPPGVTLGDWVAGALPQRPTTADVDYHLSTLFPPVRPHGYLEIRYLDAQPGDEWIAPVAMLAALFGDHRTTERALELAQPVAGRWLEAYRCGLADPALRRTAEALTELAADRPALPPGLSAHVIETIQRRLRRADVTEEQ